MKCEWCDKTIRKNIRIKVDGILLILCSRCRAEAIAPNYGGIPCKCCGAESCPGIIDFRKCPVYSLGSNSFSYPTVEYLKEGEN